MTAGGWANITQLCQMRYSVCMCLDLEDHSYVLLHIKVLRRLIINQCILKHNQQLDWIHSTGYILDI